MFLIAILIGFLLVIFTIFTIGGLFGYSIKEIFRIIDGDVFYAMYYLIISIFLWLFFILILYLIYIK